MSDKVSMKDIAKELGVSVALVSYVLNGKLTNRINVETADKIRKLAKELNYRPNQIAKSLKSRKTFTIGLIVADISNLFYSSIANYIEEEANTFGYNVIFGSAYEDPARFAAILEVFIAKQVDGLILAVPDGGQIYLSQVQQVNIPFVVLDREFEGIDPKLIVNIDNYRASEEVMKHLFDNGYSNIAAVALQSNLQHLKARERGFSDAFRKLTGRPHVIYEILEKELEEKIEQTILRAIRIDKVDAFYFLTNRIAMAGLAVLARHHIDVPDQVGIVCFDEADAYQVFKTELTVVQQPLKAMSQTAVKRVLGHDTFTAGDPFGTTLLVKESSKRRRRQEEPEHITYS